MNMKLVPQIRATATNAGSQLPVGAGTRSGPEFAMPVTLLHPYAICLAKIGHRDGARATRPELASGPVTHRETAGPVAYCLRVGSIDDIADRYVAAWAPLDPIGATYVGIAGYDDR